jgi:hypothetical protein
LGGDERLTVSNHSVAASVLAFASGVGTQGEFTEQDGIAALEDFGVCYSSVGHAGGG